jgi:hypothetical protein
VAQSTVSSAVSSSIAAPLPMKSVLPWAVFFGTLMMVLLYFIGAK